MRSLLLLALIGGASGALAADPDSRESVGPFAMTMIPNFEASAKRFPTEDAKSPLVESHLFEQFLYAGFYAAHYDSRISEVAPLPGNAYGADDLGRPLWFDAEGGRDLLSNIAGGLFASEQFDNLDRLFDDWNDPKERRADGRWKIGAFVPAMSMQFAHVSSWESGYQRIRSWREKSPTSRAAAIAEAIYWISYAGDARGSGYADTVTAEGWKLYGERLAKAESTLLESAPYAASSPLWDLEYLTVGNLMSWPLPKRMAAFKAAYDKENSYSGIFTDMVPYLQPKWGGSWKLVDDFIKTSVDMTKGREGLSMYARMYLMLDGCECGGFNLLRDTRATWPDLKSSFDDLVRLYPHSGWWANRYAVYACKADDKEAFQKMRFLLGKAIITAAWPGNYSLDLCEHKFASPPL